MEGKGMFETLKKEITSYIDMMEITDIVFLERIQISLIEYRKERTVCKEKVKQKMKNLEKFAQAEK